MVMGLGRLFPALAVLATSAIALPPAQVSVIERVIDDADSDGYRRYRKGKGLNNRRGKGKINPPKSRPNRLTVSKRVRRKHCRRAA